MSFEQLLYITEVYKAGTISGASEICHISIPGLSQSISSLEIELGVKIFKRSRQGMIPTNEGIEVIKKAYEVLMKMEELKDLGKSQHKLSAGKLNVSASPSLMILILKSAHAFKRDYPNVDFSITERPANEIIQSVKINEDDIGFSVIDTNLLKDLNDWKYETLINDKIYLCVGSNSPLASRLSIEPHEILDQSLVPYSGIGMKVLVDNFFTNHGKMNILFESNQIEIIKSTIAAGFGVSFLSGLLLRNDLRVKNGQIVPLTINNFKISDVPFGWFRQKNHYHSPIAKKFLKYIEKQIELDDY